MEKINKNENATDFTQKTNKGSEIAPESLVESTLDMVRKNCVTNNEIYLIRNIIELKNRGFDANLKHILYLLKVHGANTIMIVKDDKTTLEYQKEYGIPASNIGYALNPIASGIFKNKIDLQEISLFQEKSCTLLDNLKDTENLAIELIAKNNISTDGLPSGFVRMIEVRKEEIKVAIKKEKENKAKTLKLIEVQKIKDEKVRIKKEKAKQRREERLQILRSFINQNPKLEDKTLEEWIDFSKNMKIKGIDEKSPIETIFSEIIRIINIILGHKPIENAKTEKQTEIVLPSKESKTKDYWIEYAKTNNIDLAGATLKDDIYDLIKLDYEEKIKK